MSSLRELRNSKKLVYQEWRNKWKKNNYRDEIRKVEGSECSIRPCGPLKDFGFWLNKMRDPLKGFAQTSDVTWLVIKGTLTLNFQMLTCNSFYIMRNLAKSFFLWEQFD